MKKPWFIKEIKDIEKEDGLWIQIKYRKVYIYYLQVVAFFEWIMED